MQKFICTTGFLLHMEQNIAAINGPDLPKVSRITVVQQSFQSHTGVTVEKRQTVKHFDNQ